MGETHIYIYKLPMEKIIEHGNVIESYTDEEAIMNGELVPISTSQLTWKIYDYYRENGIDGRIRDAIINIVVQSASGSQAKKVAAAYNKLAHSGFDLNGRHYVRLCAGSGQLRHNTITFVLYTMYGYLMEALLCGITPDELGEDFSVSKFNAYLGLSESGMRFLQSAPRVCVVSDYEEIKPHFEIDFIETERTSGQSGNKVDKKITRRFYDDEAMGFAPLNSFDGQGLADPAWMKRVALELGYLKTGCGYVPSEYILRAPWCKGLVVAFDFKSYCREHGVTVLKDVYGHEYPVDEIDVLLSVSQFKMWKFYGKHGGWQYHQDSMKKYHLRWGVVVANREKDDDYRALNYQYLQSLDLNSDDINELCKHTEDLLAKLCSGDVETVYRTLVGFSAKETDESGDYCGGDIEPSKRATSLLQKAIAHNHELIQDSHIQALIYREAEAKFNAAKIGKLLCRGGYSFIVSDPVAQIQHIIKSHAVDGDNDIVVSGLIPAGHIHSPYWSQQYPVPEQVVLMRSPLVDSSEVTVCSLAQTPEMEKWYSFIKSGLIFSIFDLSTLALQNADFDGDRCFCSNDRILIKGAQKNPVPILYPSAGAQLKGAVTPESVIESDIRGLNSAVGSLSNQATSLYALRSGYQKGSWEYAELSRRIKIISELVGVEIDKIKTGIPPVKPSSWNNLKVPYEQYIDADTGKTQKVLACSPEDRDRILRHNALIPSKKPYFMRYIYDKMDRDIAKYDKAFDSTSKYNNGVRLQTLLNSDYSSLDDAGREILDRYYRYFPAVKTKCITNVICEKFERLQKELKKKNGARNMLPDFVTPQEIDESVLTQMSDAVDLFQRQKQFIVRRSNTVRTESNKQMAKESIDRFSILRKYIREQIMDLVDNDIQTAYNYLTELTRRKQCNESTVWALLDDSILLVIPHKKYHRGAAA